MKTKIYKANSRGHAVYDWLDTHYSFSFADYYNPDRVHFGNLRVLNDDIIKAGTGFGRHPHDNMEIITIPVAGQLTHKDSMENEQRIKVDEVQVMSAGTGIFHSEYNNSDEDANTLQIWILPKYRNIKPTYHQAWFDPADALNKWQFLVNGGNSPLQINQDARISRIRLNAGTNVNYSFLPNAYGSFLFVVEGKIDISGQLINSRDAIEITGSSEYELKAVEESFVINIEI